MTNNNSDIDDFEYKENTPKKKRQKQRLAGIDLCACGHNRKCEGDCRKSHTKDGVFKCSECYRLEDESNPSKKKRRTWKYGKQNDSKNPEKDKRRERWEKRNNINS